MARRLIRDQIKKKIKCCARGEGQLVAPSPEHRSERSEDLPRAKPEGLPEGHLGPEGARAPKGHLPEASPRRAKRSRGEAEGRLKSKSLGPEGAGGFRRKPLGFRRKPRSCSENNVVVRRTTFGCSEGTSEGGSEGTVVDEVDICRRDEETSEAKSLRRGEVGSLRGEAPQSFR